jgi:hypothetical protein
MKIRMNVATYDEWFNSPLDAAEAEITEEKASTIKTLAGACKFHDIYKCTKFDYSLDYFSVDWESEDEGFKEYDGRVECVTLNVTTTDFFWSGYYKHTNIRWETDSIPVKSLDSGEEFIDLWEGN